MSEQYNVSALITQAAPAQDIIGRQNSTLDCSLTSFSVAFDDVNATALPLAIWLCRLAGSMVGVVIAITKCNSRSPTPTASGFGQVSSDAPKSGNPIVIVHTSIDPAGLSNADNLTQWWAPDPRNPLIIERAINFSLKNSLSEQDIWVANLSWDEGFPNKPIRAIRRRGVRRGGLWQHQDHAMSVGLISGGTRLVWPRHSPRWRAINAAEWPVVINQFQSQLNLLLTTNDVVQSPFLNYDFPSVPFLASSDKGYSYNYNPTGGDQPNVQTDWPTPESAPFDTLTFTDGLKVLLQSKDKFPPRQTDWPLPSFQLLPFTHLDAVRKQLIGKDQLPNRWTEFPLPDAPTLLAKEFSDSLKQNLAGQDSLPNRQTDWLIAQPNARDYSFIYQGAIYLPVIVVQPPFYKTDWPNPSYIQKLALSYLDNFKQELAGQDSFPNRQGDWPSINILQVGDKFYTSSGPLYYIIPKPFAQYDWTLPHSSIAVDESFAQKKFTGRDSVPNRQTDWLVCSIYFPAKEVTYPNTLAINSTTPIVVTVPWCAITGFSQGGISGGGDIDVW